MHGNKTGENGHCKYQKDSTFCQYYIFMLYGKIGLLSSIPVLERQKLQNAMHLLADASF